jgi:hypothetical protein
MLAVHAFVSASLWPYPFGYPWGNNPHLYPFLQGGLLLLASLSVGLAYVLKQADSNTTSGEE